MPYVETDSFTTRARVEALVRHVSTATTKPTTQEVLDRMAQQAAVVNAVLRRYGYVTTTATLLADTTEPGKTIQRLCDEANAFLAAAYVLQMHDVVSVDRKMFDSLLAAAYAIIGSPDGSIPGLLGLFLQTVALPGVQIAAVNQTIEVETADLFHGATARF